MTSFPSAPPSPSAIIVDSMPLSPSSSSLEVSQPAPSRTGINAANAASLTPSWVSASAGATHPKSTPPGTPCSLEAPYCATAQASCLTWVLRRASDALTADPRRAAAFECVTRVSDPSVRITRAHSSAACAASSASAGPSFQLPPPSTESHSTTTNPSTSSLTPPSTSTSLASRSNAPSAPRTAHWSAAHNKEGRMAPAWNATSVSLSTSEASPRASAARPGVLAVATQVSRSDTEVLTAVGGTRERSACRKTTSSHARDPSHPSRVLSACTLMSDAAQPPFEAVL
mmetsp:Transcript_39233/g.91675  ORF Transcript_39233/g.91675 Transcript_39233/m.91675 type:complete len:286 (-) Transcript_39233:1111-1968(-)